MGIDLKRFFGRRDEPERREGQGRYEKGVLFASPPVRVTAVDERGAPIDADFHPLYAKAQMVLRDMLFPRYSPFALWEEFGRLEVLAIKWLRGVVPYLIMTRLWYERYERPDGRGEMFHDGADLVALIVWANTGPPGFITELQEYLTWLCDGDVEMWRSFRERIFSGRGGIEPWEVTEALGRERVALHFDVVRRAIDMVEITPKELKKAYILVGTKEERYLGANRAEDWFERRANLRDLPVRPSRGGAKRVREETVEISLNLG
ncbi:hypothetical protein [Thermosulfurimonas sp. F29]|uniref:hypothetical protein n=1 Tax=Thermosulfurimonas sp. F29 TaxID=2867247 RepID=UPI001C839815|nr:hypothetical protein [Thermosulfurimonas sp. F29]MBX6423347.1 hypothetical protein [Thermosulfurimonas sp. F29]